MHTPSDITIAIPTLGRNQILVDTIKHLFNQDPKAREILVVDQTPRHDRDTEEKLLEWDMNNVICWIRLEKPSIPKAMNKALQRAKCPIVLFVDDDIIPAPGLVNTHVSSYQNSDVWAINGQVLQPGELSKDIADIGSTQGLEAFLGFPFNSCKKTFIKNAIACNLSVRKDRAIEIGGFDENFVRVAYRFETEFCRRVWQNGGKVLFEPRASVRHLRAPTGGTRRYGNHLSSPSPAHGVGDYYFAMRSGINSESILYMLKRPFRATCTKFHLRNPWYIPVKWIGELSAFFWAVALALRGPKYVSN